MPFPAFSQEGNRRKFPPLGKIEWVRPIARPPFNPRQYSRNARINQGLKYERYVNKKLFSLYGGDYAAGQWFCYKTSLLPDWKYCQLDGILTPSNSPRILVEIKYQHCPDAYFQLTQLYLPLMEFLYPGEPLALCEVVKWYDPATVFPHPVTRLPRIHEARPGDFSVHILNR